MRSLFSLVLLVALSVGCGAPDAPGDPAADARVSGPAARADVPAAPSSAAVTEAMEFPGSETTNAAVQPAWGELSEAEWRERLTDEEFRILREKGTERAFTGKYHATKAKGTYECAGCGEKLFVSETKFDSGCGWPSFYEPASETVIAEHRDSSFGMVRIEVTCKKCGGHLGHVFDDGPEPTGLRYCINSVSIQLRPEDDTSKKPPGTTPAVEK